MLKDNPTKRAAQAHTDLNVFASIVSILEGGHIYTIASKAAAAKIIRICHVEQQKRLREYDRAIVESTQ